MLINSSQQVLAIFRILNMHPKDTSLRTQVRKTYK